ncbi:hypothetical protein [Rhizobium sp. NZLR4b]|uniref:hypothetical protein n=1 Tax=Rhizobium sp. NZLR4b TaxID=2731102 RepID=UPI001C837B62|nr:hypothetical protein [Rhizobium sp. NZLR4b]MBX5164785.1 hypothetical protein [Rhizobium sp. NZLR4b]
MTNLYNNYGMVEIVQSQGLSDRFFKVRFMDLHLGYLHRFEEGYLVFADSMRYRMDGAPHPLDVSEENEIGEQNHET